MLRARFVTAVLAAALSLLAGASRAQVPPADVGQTRRPDADAPRREDLGSAAESAILDRLGRSPALGPSFDASVPPVIRFRLEEAYPLALHVVLRQPSCGALFGGLRLRGADALALTRYRGGGEIGACLRHVPAFTCVGCDKTVLCPTFTRLGRAEGATILIHEALHFAGLRERPAYAGEMSASEITNMVQVGCHL